MSRQLSLHTRKGGHPCLKDSLIFDTGELSNKKPTKYQARSARPEISWGIRFYYKIYVNMQVADHAFPPAFILISRIAWSINRYLNIVKRFVQISEQIIMNSLTERFKYLREQILGPKASKRKFAEFLGVHPSRYQAYESNITNPSATRPFSLRNSTSP